MIRCGQSGGMVSMPSSQRDDVIFTTDASKHLQTIFPREIDFDDGAIWWSLEKGTHVTPCPNGPFPASFVLFVFFSTNKIAQFTNIVSIKL